jgi:hypothetical protein
VGDVKGPAAWCEIRGRRDEVRGHVVASPASHPVAGAE